MLNGFVNGAEKLASKNPIFRLLVGKKHLNYLKKTEEVSARLTEAKRAIGLKPHEHMNEEQVRKAFKKLGGLDPTPNHNMLLKIYGKKGLSELSKHQYRKGDAIKFDINNYKIEK